MFKKYFDTDFIFRSYVWGLVLDKKLYFKNIKHPRIHLFFLLLPFAEIISKLFFNVFFYFYSNYYINKYDDINSISWLLVNWRKRIIFDYVLHSYRYSIGMWYFMETFIASMIRHGLCTKLFKRKIQLRYWDWFFIWKRILWLSYESEKPFGLVPVLGRENALCPFVNCYFYNIKCCFYLKKWAGSSRGLFLVTPHEHYGDVYGNDGAYDIKDFLIEETAIPVGAAFFFDIDSYELTKPFGEEKELTPTESSWGRIGDLLAGYLEWVFYLIHEGLEVTYLSDTARAFDLCFKDALSDVIAWVLAVEGKVGNITIKTDLKNTTMEQATTYTFFTNMFLSNDQYGIRKFMRALRIVRGHHNLVSFLRIKKLTIIYYTYVDLCMFSDIELISNIEEPDMFFYLYIDIISTTTPEMSYTRLCQYYRHVWFSELFGFDILLKNGSRFSDHILDKLIFFLIDYPCWKLDWRTPEMCLNIFSVHYLYCFYSDAPFWYNMDSTLEFDLISSQKNRFIDLSANLTYYKRVDFSKVDLFLYSNFVWVSDYTNNIFFSKISNISKRVHFYRLSTFKLNSAHKPSKTIKDFYIEIGFILVPTVILSTIILPSLGFLYADEHIGFLNSANQLKVMGHQWFWTYEFVNRFIKNNNSYFYDKSLEFDSHLVEDWADSAIFKDIEFLKAFFNERSALKRRLSKDFFDFMGAATPFYKTQLIGDKLILTKELQRTSIGQVKPTVALLNSISIQHRLLDVDYRLTVASYAFYQVYVSSTDVIHSWALPSLGIKTDAVPGRLNRIELCTLRNGVFYGQCSEICGVFHAFMPVVLESVDFENWLDWLYNLSMKE